MGEVHPEGAAQATDDGKCLNSLDPIDRRIYAGYGDYNANTGPIHVESVSASDPLSAWTDHLTVNTEQIGRYRQLGDGRIVTPHIDPHTDDEATAGYAQGADGSWVDENIIPHTEHLFDQAQFAEDLWICGADLDQSGETVDAGACVWRSTDSGTSYERSLIGPRAPAAGDLKRFYALVVAGDPPKLRVREPITGDSFVWTGSEWIDDGIKPIPDSINGGPGLQWGTGYVIPSDLPFGPTNVTLYLFDGAATTTLADNAHGFSVGDDGNLYILDQFGVSRVTPGSTTLVRVLEQLPPAGNQWCSLCVLPGSTQAVVGTASSQLALVDLS